MCEDVEEYKKVIEYMTEEMNEVCRKVMEKDTKIEKLEAQLQRYQAELSQRWPLLIQPTLQLHYYLSLNNYAEQSGV